MVANIFPTCDISCYGLNIGEYTITKLLQCTQFQYHNLLSTNLRFKSRLVLPEQQAYKLYFKQSYKCLQSCLRPGHAKLRRRVLRVLRRRGCMKPVQCQHECYVMKQHCLLCVWVCKNEYINNCQTVVMQRCKRVHFQAYSYGPVCKATLKLIKHCH